MRINPSSRHASGKLLGAVLPLILVLGAGGAGFYWWQSPARKIQGDWDIPAGGFIPMSGTLTMKGGLFQKNGTFTMVTSLGAGNLSLSSDENGAYTLDTSKDPATLTMTPLAKDRKPVSAELAKGHTVNIRFIDNDTLEVSNQGAISIKTELHRKK